MCGIAGYVSNRQLNSDAMCKSLHHRGPDAHGLFNNVINEQYINLTHTRLKILDLSNGANQPFTSIDGNIQLIYNGEIYNYIALKNKYFKNQYFKTTSDTEVILKLYELLGIDFIHELQGDFAISIVDVAKQKLYLIRDRLGVKPLYFYHHTNTFVFASEIKAIKAAGIHLELNKEAIPNFFIFKYTPENETLYKYVKRVQPGTFLAYDLSKKELTEKTYWKLRKNKNYLHLDYDAAVDKTFTLTQQAITDQLISDVPIGAFTSGGLDSSIIAYFLKDNKNIYHYCAQKKKEDLLKEDTTDDYFFADKLSKDWNFYLSGVSISDEQLTIDNINKINYYADDLIADASQIPSYLITVNATHRSKVMLSGMGADELFLGYAGHLITLLSLYFDKLPSALSKPVSSYFASFNQGSGNFIAYKRYLHKLGKYYLPLKDRLGSYNIVGDYENSLRVTHNNENVEQILQRYFKNDIDSEEIFDNLFWFEKENFLRKNLNYADRMSMANGVESRVPFVDHRLVEFAYSIKREYKLSSTGMYKRVLKDAFANKVPDYIINRRKAGFGMPLRSIFGNEQSVYRLLDINFLTSFKEFNIPHIQKCIQQHVKGVEDNSALLYAIISFQQWYKTNF